MTMLMSCAALTLGVGLVYAGGILPAVSAAGVPVGGLSQEEAVEKIRAEWQTITVQDEGRVWEINPATLGLSLDAEGTAKAAYEAGRNDLFDLIPGIIGEIEIQPEITINMDAAQAGLQELASQF